MNRRPTIPVSRTSIAETSDRTNSLKIRAVEAVAPLISSSNCTLNGAGSRYGYSMSSFKLDGSGSSAMDQRSPIEPCRYVPLSGSCFSISALPVSSARNRAYETRAFCGSMRATARITNSWWGRRPPTTICKGSSIRARAGPTTNCRRRETRGHQYDRGGEAQTAKS
jgi:hypothetical protein